MDEQLNELLTETNENLAVLDVELAELEQSQSGPECGDNSSVNRLDAPTRRGEGAFATA